MKLESLKSELFNNEIKKPELIIGGRMSGGTEKWTICTNPHTGEVCESYDGPDGNNF